MAISIGFKDKYVYFGPEAGLHTQGEARAEVYDVTGPRYHDGHDLSAMTWYVRASHPDYMTIINKQLRVSVDPDNEGQIIITWPVDADFTAYSGQLDVQFVARSSTGEEIIKLQSNGLQFAASVEGTVIPPRNMFEAAVEQIGQLADEAANAAAQSKLDAGRAEDAQEAAAQSAQQAQQAQQAVAGDVEQAAVADRGRCRSGSCKCGGRKDFRNKCCRQQNCGREQRFRCRHVGNERGLQRVRCCGQRLCGKDLRDQRCRQQDRCGEQRFSGENLRDQCRRQQNRR